MLIESVLSIAAHGGLFLYGAVPVCDADFGRFRVCVLLVCGCSRRMCMIEGIALNLENDGYSSKK